MGIGKNKSNNTSSQSSVQTQNSSSNLDPEIKNILLSNAETTRKLADTPFQPYSGERVAGFTEAGLQAQDMARNIAGSDDGLIKEAANTARGLSQFVPQTVTGSGYRAQNADAARLSRGEVRDVTAGQLKDVDLSAYYNPYRQEVIDRTTADQERARQIQINNDRSRAAGAGAYGGSRHGVADALTNEASQRTLGGLVSQLRMAGFDKAVQGAQGDIDRRFAADQGNQGMDFNVVGQNASLVQQANLANAAAANQAAMFGQEQSLQAQLANQQAAANAASLKGNAAQLLSGLSDQSLQQQTAKAQLLGAVGDQQKGQQQAINDAAYQEHLREEERKLQMQSLVNASLGLIGNPVLSNSSSSATSTGTSSGKSSGFDLKIPT